MRFTLIYFKYSMYEDIHEICQNNLDPFSIFPKNIYDTGHLCMREKKSQRLNYVCIQSFFFFTIHQNVFKQRSIVYIFSNQISLTQVVLLRLHCKLHVMWRSKIWTVKYKYAINFTFLNLSKRFIFQLINCAKTAFIDIK